MQAQTYAKSHAKLTHLAKTCTIFADFCTSLSQIHKNLHKLQRFIKKTVATFAPKYAKLYAV